MHFVFVVKHDEVGEGHRAELSTFGVREIASSYYDAVILKEDTVSAKFITGEEEQSFTANADHMPDIEGKVKLTDDIIKVSDVQTDDEFKENV